MRHALPLLAVLAFPAGLAAQADSIETALLAGAHSKECPEVMLRAGTGVTIGMPDYWISVDGPMMRVTCRSAAAAKLHQKLDRSALSPAITGDFITIAVYPGDPKRPDPLVSPSRIVLKVLGQAKDSTIEPDSVRLAADTARNGVGTIVVLPRLNAYFARSIWPRSDFQVTIVTTGTEYHVKMGKSERGKVH